MSLYVTRARAEFPPLVTMEQTIDIAQRNLFARSLAQPAMHLADGQNLAVLGTFLQTRQKILLVFPGQIPPPSVSRSSGNMFTPWPP